MTPYAKEQDLLLPMPDKVAEYVKTAVAHFHRNAEPGVLYDNGKLVQRDGSYYIEWTPIGFIE